MLVSRIEKNNTKKLLSGYIKKIKFSYILQSKPLQARKDCSNNKM